MELIYHLIAEDLCTPDMSVQSLCAIHYQVSYVLIPSCSHICHARLILYHATAYSIYYSA